jgi:hypothetical protein
LRKFLNNAAKSIFAIGISAIVGDAQANGHPVRHKPDFHREGTRDGTLKLVRLYEYLGFSRMKGNNMALTAENFTRAVGSKRHNKTVKTG